jgi:hypothetical protein
MRSRLEPADVFQDLGDKITDGFAVAVDRTREHLAEYRQVTWLASRHSATGLANWIADQLMRNLADELDGIPGVEFVDGVGHTREIVIRGRSGCYYRFRAKRHHTDGAVSTFPTAAALDFMTQEDDDLTLFELREVRLTVGYMWDIATQVIGEAVVSLRDEKGRKIVWLEPVPVGGAAAGTVIPITEPIQPTGPSVDTPAAGPALPDMALPTKNNDKIPDGGDDQR